MVSSNKKYSPALQKARIGGTANASVDPALGNYALALLRATAGKADAKTLVTKLTLLVETLQQMAASGSSTANIVAIAQRICMHGYLPSNVVVPFVETLASVSSNVKLRRLMYYLLGSLLGPGGAGTPVPLLPAAGGAYTSLAVHVSSFDVLSRAWTALGTVESIGDPEARLALRALSSATHCALTTLPAGKENDRKVGALVKDTKAAIGMALESIARQHKKDKNRVAELQQLGRIHAAALLAARASLPRKEMASLLKTVAAMLGDASPLTVRHGLAVLCRIPSARLKAVLEPLSGPLRAAFRRYSADDGPGLMHDSEGLDSWTDQEFSGVICLQDVQARIYLARLLCKLLFSGVLSSARKHFLWQVVMRLAFSPRERPMVRLETWKAMFGEVLPQPLSLFPVGDASQNTPAPLPFSEGTEAQLAGFKATAWRATCTVLLPSTKKKGKGRQRRAVTADDDGKDRFEWVVMQLTKMLESASQATICGGARVLRCILEARAHAAHADGEEYFEDARITESITHQVLPALRACAETTATVAVKSRLLEALIWAHLPMQPTVTPDLFQTVVNTPSVTGSSPKSGFAPWPPSEVSAVLDLVDRRLLSAPELSGPLLYAVARIAAYAPSSLDPGALLRLWQRAMALEEDIGVHNGARDAALHAAVDLLASRPPVICSVAANSSPLEVAIGMKECHAWNALREMAASWLGEHANQATNEQCWYPPPSVDRKAPSSHEKQAFGEPEMLALMAMRNPMLMSVISQLQRTLLCAEWPLRVVAAHALGTIAVKSEEPFRFHCYTLLAAAAGGTDDDATDIVGLSVVVRPMLEVLDNMYAGAIVMKQYCDAYGLDWTKWHSELFESVQRRHEALVADVRQHITDAVPDGAFYPLGIKSQILLTGQAVVVDPEALAEVQDHAIAKAQAAWQDEQRAKEAENALAAEEMYAEEDDIDDIGDDTASETGESTAGESTAMSFDSIDIDEIDDLGAELDLNQNAQLADAFDPFDPAAWAAREKAQADAAAAAAEAQPGATAQAGGEQAAAETPRSAGGAAPPPPARAPSAKLPPPPPSRRSMVSERTASIARMHSVASTAAGRTTAASSIHGTNVDSDDDELETRQQAALFTVGSAAERSTHGGSLAGGAAPFVPPEADDETSTVEIASSFRLRQSQSNISDRSLEYEPATAAYVAYDFDAEVEGELTVREGDQVYVIEYLDGGWAHVQLVSTGETGNVPEWAVQAYEDTYDAVAADEDAVFGEEAAPGGAEARETEQTTPEGASGGMTLAEVSERASMAASARVGGRVTEDNPFGVEQDEAPAEGGGHGRAPSSDNPFAGAAQGGKKGATTADNPFGADR